MAIDFSAFDEKGDLQELQNEVQNAPDNDFADVPDGTYTVEETSYAYDGAAVTVSYTVDGIDGEGSESS